MSNMCTILLVTWLMAVSSYEAHMCMHLSYKPIKYLPHMAYVPNLLGIFVFGTYMVITSEVEVAIGCI